MSVASSASSMRSVSFMGKEMTLDQALEDVVREIQGCLNDLQFKLRSMATLEEQQVDDEEDFKQAVILEDETVDLVNSLTELLSELPIIAAEIRGETPRECKAWYSQHKTEVKEKRKKDKEVKKAEKLAKEEAKKAELPALAKVCE